MTNPCREDLTSGGIAIAEGLENALGIGDPAGGGPVGFGQCRSGEQRLDASAAAAVAQGAVRHDFVVAPFARDVLRTTPDPAAQDDAATDSRSQNDSEGNRSVAAGAEPCFRKGKAVGVIFEMNFPPEALFQILVNGLAVEALGIGILQQAVSRGKRSGRADPQRQAFACGFQRAHQLGNPAEDMLVATFLFRRNPVAVENLSVRPHPDSFDLGPAQIDAKTLTGHAMLMPFLGLPCNVVVLNPNRLVGATWSAERIDRLWPVDPGRKFFAPLGRGFFGVPLAGPFERPPVSGDGPRRSCARWRVENPLERAVPARRQWGAAKGAGEPETLLSAGEVDGRNLEPVGVQCPRGSAPGAASVVGAGRSRLLQKRGIRFARDKGYNQDSAGGNAFPRVPSRLRSNRRDASCRAKPELDRRRAPVYCRQAPVGPDARGPG